MRMYCRHCGSVIAEGARFCEYCGTRVLQAKPTFADGAENARGALAEGAEGAEHAEKTDHFAAPLLFTDFGASPRTDGPTVYPAAHARRAPLAVRDDMPMKWHGFLVHFALWAASGSIASIGFETMTGSRYGQNREHIYSAVPQLQIPDVIAGLLLIATAALGFYTAARLLKRKRGAPKLLLAVHGAVIVLNLAHPITTALLVKSASRMSSVSGMLLLGIGGALVGAILLIVNMIYYKNREHLFVN
ncbi:MAG: zinc ribbon domain-containing protein [Clostridia bacterium]|nr:zinc ribbon domain-containing protein [Clostridia bacterium]